MGVDPVLIAAMRVQLARRRALLAGGARPVGWKVGAGRREFLGGMAVGHLTTATMLGSGGTYRPGPSECTHADAEVAVVIGADGRVAAFGSALEICDLAGDDEPAAVVAANVFHRAVAVGGFAAAAPTAGRLVVDGRLRAEAAVPDDLAERVERVRQVLGAVGERLEPGDIVITGSVVQCPVRPGEGVRAELSGADPVELAIGPTACRVTGVDHVVIGVSDWAVATRFYRDVVGAEVIDLGDGRVSFRLGSTQLNVHGPGVDLSENVARLPVRPGNSDMCLHWSASVEEAITHLAEQGVAVETGPVRRPGARGEGTSVYFRDPDGSLLEFICYG
jgi:catechol 2,3-dioxygenase-like lactoylglutathione lyase family enzyme/2-keto-4-pentenoate hydratase